jgi:eukaryotic-like serine/threonine-protein kinase
MRYRMPLLGEMVGLYRIGEQLGVGGFGSVYKAERDGRPFALKFILGRGELDAWGEREISILLHLRHPNVARFAACDRWPDARTGYLFLAMEYVEGRTLEAWAREENPSARQVVEKFLPLVKALGDVHQQGVIHRDVKPANILVRESDGQPVLVDFGLGAFAGARPASAPGLPPGTPEYRSPQAMRAHAECVSYEPGAADDFWALGVTLYWLLTDRLPFGTRDDAGMVKGILAHTPEPPRQSNPRVPCALGELCQRMLEKAPEARFPDAEMLGAALEKLLAGAEASWDVPLLDSFSPEYTTTEHVVEMEDPEEDEMERELRQWEKRRPKRGQRPAEKVEALAPMEAAPPAPVAEAAPVAPVEPVAPAAPAPSSGAKLFSPSVGFFSLGMVLDVLRWPALAAALLAMVLGAAVLVKRAEPAPAAAPVAVSTSSEATSTLQAGFVREVEIPSKPSESAAGGEGAVPALGTPTPAPTTMTEMLPETEKKTAPKKRGIRSVAKKCVGAACCATLAGCPAPQVRPTPAPEACPPGAVEAMKELGIEVGAGSTASFVAHAHPMGIVTVEEGFTSIRSTIPWKELPDNTVLRGRLFIGEERVYGRFTEAETRAGKTLPVCLELRDRKDHRRGVVREADGGPERARIFSTVTVRAVDRFE